MKKTIPQSLLFLLLALLACLPASAQSNQVLVSSPGTTAPKTVLSQTVLSSLAALPEADTLVFINPQRILNEAMPRVMPEKDLAEMRKAFSQMKQFTGVDPARLDYIVLAIRFRKPSAELSFNPPELMMVTAGDFSADSLILMARGVAGDKLRDEKYGDKTLSLITIDPIAREAEKNPMLKSLSELAIAPLNATTIAAGTPGYLKAAVDAAAGQGRISSESLSSLLRDPEVLMSVAGSPLTSFIKSFGMLGTEANPRAPRCESKFGDFYASVTMDASNFNLRGVMNADNPDTAKIINNLIGGLARQASSAVTDKAAQTMLQRFMIGAEQHEVILRADVPQQMLIDLIKEQMKPKKQEPTTSPTPPAKKPVVRKRRPRR